MKKITAAWLSIFLFCTGTVTAEEPSEAFGSYSKSQYSNQVVIVNWHSKQGLNRLSQSTYRNDFQQLAHFYSPQVFASFCGIASGSLRLLLEL